jgi:hypothetical protein
MSYRKRHFTYLHGILNSELHGSGMRKREKNVFFVLSSLFSRWTRIHSNSSSPYSAKLNISSCKFSPHCKWRAGESPIKMSGSHLWIPRNETVQPSYFQNRIIMFYLPIPSLIDNVSVRDLYIILGSVCLFCCSQTCGPILGIYVYRSQIHECGN